MQAERICTAKKCKKPCLEGFAVCDSHFQRPSGLMFGLWAIDKAVTSQGATMLVAASHHIHISDVLEMNIEPLAPLVSSGHYHEQLVLRRVCEVIGKAESSYYDELLGMSDILIVTELVELGGGIFDDENLGFMQTVVKQWRARVALQEN